MNERLKKRTFTILGGLNKMVQNIPKQCIYVPLIKETGPFILCQDSGEQHFATVSIPHKEAFRLGLDFLIEKGHTKIAIGLARKNGMNSHFRLKEYKEALAAIGEPYREEWVFERSLTITDGQKLFSEWKGMEEKPTAILLTALHYVTICKELGVTLFLTNKSRSSKSEIVSFNEAM